MTRDERGGLVAWMRAAGALALAAWFGGALLFSATVAPALFAVLPSRELAGAVVGRVLPVLNWSGLAVALALSASARRLGARRAEIVALALFAAANLCGLLIGARIQSLRRAMSGPIDALAATDPLRQAFGYWHTLSVIALGVGLIAAAVAFFVAVGREHKARD
ncbi:MAG: hypothetical protein C4334_07750 [Pyrinomonas sp.]|mgnify:CR=1 FL=1|uniref:DUF4149 domain-containing protein n=1 Tax=Pyrinomonas sp. TaxID=2080306 RepID=UPI00332E868F